MRLWLLGDFRVRVGSRLIEGGRWRQRRAASLIKLLALAPGHRLHRERVMDLLWPDLDAKVAASNLRQALHVARRILGSQSPATASRYLERRGGLMELCPVGQLWVDVEAFEEAATAARRARDPGSYQAALDLYAGDLLPEDLYEGWTEERREELRRSYLGLLVELARAHESHDEHGPAVEAFQRLVAAEPATEEAHAGLIRLYALSGQRGEALRQYESLREVLRREFGAEPGPATRRLRDDVAAGRTPPTQPPIEDLLPSRETPIERRNNLPAPLSSFVGREREMTGVKRELAMTRLLTLTGAGGCGKTRLALEVAREVAGAYPDGAWLVELAGFRRGTWCLARWPRPWGCARSRAGRWWRRSLEPRAASGCSSCWTVASTS